MEDHGEFRVLCEKELEAISALAERGLFGKFEITRLLVTVRTYRAVLRDILKLFRPDPLKVIVQADTVSSRTLKEWIRLTRIDEGSEPDR